MNRITLNLIPETCPRCKQTVEDMEMSKVRIVKDIGSDWEDGDSDLSPVDNYEVEIEEWPQYCPCECIISPGTHKELVNPTTPTEVKKL